LFAIGVVEVFVGFVYGPHDGEQPAPNTNALVWKAAMFVGILMGRFCFQRKRHTNDRKV